MVEISNIRLKFSVAAIVALGLPLSFKSLLSIQGTTLNSYLVGQTRNRFTLFDILSLFIYLFSQFQCNIN